MYPLKISNEYTEKHEKIFSNKKQDTKVYECV